MHIALFHEISPLTKYWVYGKEVSASGTPHLQCYILFLNQRVLTTVIKRFPSAHMEIANGRPDQAAKYCRKKEDYVEYGEAPISPKSKGALNATRYQRAWELAKKGNLDDIDPDIHLCQLQLPNLLRLKAMSLHAEDSITELDNVWYWGPSVTDISLTYKRLYPNAYKKYKTKWWDGYDGQEIVRIEEWSPDYDRLAQMLKEWGDHEPIHGEIRGGSLQIRPKKIVVTSNFCIQDCFLRPQDYEPLQLRFKEVYVPKLSVSNKLYAKEMQVETQVGRSTVKPPSAGQSNKTAMSAVQKTLDEWHKGKQSWQVAATHVSITKGKHPCDTSCGTDMAATQQSQDETRDDDTSHDTTTYIPQSLVGTPPQQMPCSHIIPRTMTQRKRRDHLGSPAVRMACKKWKARAGKLVGRPVIIGATPGVVTKHKIVDDRLGGQSDRFTIDLDHGDFTCATLQQVLRCLTTGRAFTTLR